MYAVVKRTLPHCSVACSFYLI